MQMQVAKCNVSLHDSIYGTLCQHGCNANRHPAAILQGAVAEHDKLFEMDGLQQPTPTQPSDTLTKHSSSKSLDSAPLTSPSRRPSPRLLQKPPKTPKTTPKTTLTLSSALRVYKLTKHELFWETKLDTRCLMGWNDHTIVVAFRGTASMKNAMTDLQVSVCHPHVACCLFTRELGNRMLFACFTNRVVSGVIPAKVMLQCWKNPSGNSHFVTFHKAFDSVPPVSKQCSATIVLAIT